MRSPLVDLSLGVNCQAWAVAHYLTRVENNYGFDRVETAPWYNGRERGLVFSFGWWQYLKPVLRIAVFEHRNSDDIVALEWQVPNWGMNPPTMASEGNLAYQTDNKWNDLAHSIPVGRAGDMAIWVQSRLREFADKHQLPNKEG